MKTCGISILLCLLVAQQLIVLVYLQSIESTHYRPHPNKCDGHGRCSAKEGYIEEEDHDHEIKLDKERPPVLTRDDWPTHPHDSEPDLDKRTNLGGRRPPVGSGYDGSSNPKPTIIREEEKSISGRRAGGYIPNLPGGRDGDLIPAIRPNGGYGGGHNPKPIADRYDDLKLAIRPGGGYGVGHNHKPIIDRDDDLKPAIRPGGGYRGGHDPKPTVDRADDLKLAIRPGGEYGVDHDHKPTLDRDDDLKPAIRPGGGYGGGHNPKPTVDRDDDLKPARQSSSGGGYGGGHNPKPSNDRDDDLKSERPSSGGGGRYGGGYNSKPAVGDDDIKPPRGRPSGGGYGGGYNPRPVIDRDDGIKPGSNRPSGGYNPKPEGTRGGYNSKSDEDDYEIKPARGGGVYPDNDRRPNIEDKGGYEKPKHPDYDYEDEDKPFPVVDDNCICVPYYQCNDGHIVTDGGGIIDARKTPDTRAKPSWDDKFLPPSCGPMHVCCKSPETSTVMPYEHRCGMRNPSGINSRILSPSNEGEADFGEWPWQAAVLKLEGTVSIFMCGGVLIDEYHVLTVAHCVFHLYKYNEYPLKVRLGEWDTQKTTEFLAHEDYRVSKIIVHPEFRNTSLWNDVAVLRLHDPVLFAPHIGTVCLPKYDEIFDGQNCVVTGWGKDAFDGGTFSNVMKEVALQVIDNYKCEEMLRKTRLGGFFQLHEGFLCAGGEYKLDSCKGDGGGPLVCYRKDKSYALAGIVSWGIDCGQPGVPGVYVKIQKYVDWISRTTGVTQEGYWPKH